MLTMHSGASGPTDNQGSTWGPDDRYLFTVDVSLVLYMSAVQTRGLMLIPVTVRCSYFLCELNDK